MTDYNSESSPRLVAVSNRTAYGSPRAGGLAVALSDTLAETGGQWIGWSGKIFDVPRRRVLNVDEDGVSFALIDMSKAEYEGFYLGYANSVLWPVMHNRLDLAVFDSDYFAAYKAINRQFADVVAAQTAQDDLVWVQDYHFFLLAKILKDSGCNRRTGFFLHIPFPAPEVFRSGRRPSRSRVGGSTTGSKSGTRRAGSGSAFTPSAGAEGGGSGRPA